MQHENHAEMRMEEKWMLHKHSDNKNILQPRCKQTSSRHLQLKPPLLSTVVEPSCFGLAVHHLDNILLILNTVTCKYKQMPEAAETGRGFIEGVDFFKIRA